jgi:hypothetical protein
MMRERGLLFFKVRSYRSRFKQHLVKKPHRQDRDQPVSTKILQCGTFDRHDVRNTPMVFKVKGEGHKASPDREIV